MWIFDHFCVWCWSVLRSGIKIVTRLHGSILQSADFTQASCWSWSNHMWSTPVLPPLTLLHMVLCHQMLICGLISFLEYVRMTYGWAPLTSEMPPDVELFDFLCPTKADPSSWDWPYPPVWLRNKTRWFPDWEASDQHFPEAMRRRDDNLSGFNWVSVQQIQDFIGKVIKEGFQLVRVFSLIKLLNSESTRFSITFVLEVRVSLSLLTGVKRSVWHRLSPQSDVRQAQWGQMVAGLFSPVCPWAPPKPPTSTSLRDD